MTGKRRKKIYDKSRMRCLVWIILFGAILLLPGCGEGDSVCSLSEEYGLVCEDSSGCFNDREMERKIVGELSELLEAKKTVPVETLIEQLERDSCKATLAKASISRMSRADIYTKLRDSVVVIAGIFKCNKCSKWHVGPATGFVLSESGLIATCHHVIDSPDRKAFAVVTVDGEMYPITEVVAADEAEDIAIIKIDAKGLKPLPVIAEEPVGNDISIISHPDQRYFSMTEGIVSRYFIQNMHGTYVARMAVTADFARGSSGAPVFNEFGNVVGMVTRTRSIYYNHQGDRDEKLQMVIKYCIPGKSIFKLISTESAN